MMFSKSLPHGPPCRRWQLWFQYGFSAMALLICFSSGLVGHLFVGTETHGSTIQPVNPPRQT